MESGHGSESNKHSSKDADNSRNKYDALAPLISVGESDLDSESEADIEININEKRSGSAKKSESSHSAFSSSMNSSTEDYLHMEPQMFKKSSTFPVVSPKDREETQSPQQKEKDNALGDITSKSEDLNKSSIFAPSSPVKIDTDESTTQTMSPVQSPPIQVMEKSAGYDPDRIPASIFASRSNSAMDWSTASNESLFSLQLGNSSFSREQFLMMNGDMLTEDFFNSGELNNLGEYEENRSGLPPLSPVGKLRKVKTMYSTKKLEETKAADETMKDSSKRDFADQAEEKEPELEGNGISSLINRPSDGSGASCQSFAFPILVDTRKSSLSKGRSPRQQDTKPVEYTETPKTNSIKKKDSSYCCSLPHWSGPSCWHCWCWKWCKNWGCCCCCCCCCCG